MRIAVVSPTPVPPTFGGMDRLLEGLCGALRRRHPTDLVTIPYDERTREGVLRGYYDFYHLDLSAYDRVITYKAPAYMVRHPNQVCYLSHRLRVFYDLWQPGDADHERLRDLIHWMDGWALDKARVPHLFTVGETVTRRLVKFGGIASTPIHHPTTFEPVDPAASAPPERSYFLSVGRLHPWKRVDLAIRAFMRSAAECPLRIAGEGPHEPELRELAAGDPRIEFVGRVPDGDLAALYAGAIATFFPPISEDMGLITFESFLSGAPILTVADAGEPALIVENGKTGFVTAPEPGALAEKVDWLWEHRSEAAGGMARACREWMRPVTWERLVDALLGAGEEIESRRTIPAAPSTAAPDLSAPSPDPSESSTIITLPADNPGGAGMAAKTVPLEETEKIHLLVTDNQIIDPPIGGGRIRILELYRHMPEDFTTTYIGEYDYPGPVYRDQWISPNFREILTPLTAPHFKLHNLLARLSGGAATVDVTMPVLGARTPRYRRLMAEHLPQADIVVCAHPWMLPFIPAHDKPLVYDSQNCEALVKGPMLRGTLTGRWLARRVRAVERLAVSRAVLTLACSEEDGEAFVRLYGADLANIVEAPNGVDCAKIRPADRTQRMAARERLAREHGLGAGTFVVFTGSNYMPNLEAGKFIIQTLAPEFPKVQFGLVGGVGPMFRERHPACDLPPNVRLFGFVDFELLQEIYRAADLAANPITHGSGTNIKMLDYMAAALPILTTPTGARGLRGTAGTHWVETDLAAFVGELRRLIDSPAAAREIGAAGRGLAEKRYDWTVISAGLARRLRKLAGR